MQEKTTDLKQDIYSIVKKSLCYPSGDNSQPFKFIFTKQNSVKIFCTEMIDSNLFGVTTYYVSLGCLLEILNLNAQSSGYSLNFELPDKLFTEAAFIHIYFKKNGEKSFLETESLAGMIHKRYTDRRPYFKTVVAGEVKEIFNDENEQKQKKCKLFFVGRLGEQLIAKLCELERSIWSRYEFCHMIMKSINYQILPKKNVTGMNLKNLGVHPALALLGYFEWRFRSVFDLNILLGRPWMNHLIVKKQITNSGGFGLLTLQSKTQDDIINASRYFCRTWIKICGQGYSFQPLSISSLLPLSLNLREQMPAFLDPKLKSLFQEITQMLKNEFKADPADEVFYLFRFGLPKGSLAKSALTERKAMSEVWTEE